MQKTELNNVLISAFPHARISYNEGIAIASVGTANVALALRADGTVNASANFNHVNHPNQCRQFPVDDLTSAISYLKDLIATAPDAQVQVPELGTVES